MNRRDFLGFSLAATGMVFAPKFGRWHRQGSGLLVPPPGNDWYVALYTSDGREHRMKAVATATRLLPGDVAEIDLSDTMWSPAHAVTITHFTVGGTLSGLPVQARPSRFPRGPVSLQTGDTLTIQWPDYGLRLMP